MKISLLFIFMIFSVSVTAASEYCCENEKKDSCEANLVLSNNKTRIQRIIKTDDSLSTKFAIPFLPGISKRWLRNFRKPSFCPYVICAGSCASIFGYPVIGNFTENDLLSGETPCSLPRFNLQSSENCCLKIQVENKSCH